jgi:biotin transport system substrate-specific component
MQALTLTLTKIPSWVKNTALVLGSSLVLGLFANVAIPLPFTPVPLATQPSIVLLLAVLLGSKRAPLAILSFLAQGAMGLPVFAGGFSGLARLAGPTGGYLLGYLVVAYVVGKLIESRPEKTLLSALASMAIGNGLLFVLGAAWLSTFVGVPKAIMLGIVPFLVGDLLKLFASLKILHWMGFAVSTKKQNPLASEQP